MAQQRRPRPLPGRSEESTRRQRPHGEDRTRERQERRSSTPKDIGNRHRQELMNACNNRFNQRPGIGVFGQRSRSASEQVGQVTQNVAVGGSKPPTPTGKARDVLRYE